MGVSAMNYRGDYRKQDEQGVVHFVRDVVATDEGRALEQMRWQLVDAHPEDNREFEFVSLTAVVRRPDPAEGAPV